MEEISGLQEGETPAEEEELASPSGGGFFDEEEEDETIALTAQDLDYILFVPRD